MAEKTKIAVVEDDVAIVQMYRMKFETEGYEVQTASNGKDGLELIKNFRPDIILLDLMMPVMDGEEMLKKLRSEVWGKNMKVVILTNTGETEVQDRVRGLGVNDFIIKAEMTPKEVADRLKSALQR